MSLVSLVSLVKVNAPSALPGPITTRTSRYIETVTDVYAGDYLIGDYVAPFYPADRAMVGLSVNVTTPSLDSYTLHTAATAEAAIESITEAARQYTYRSHLVRLSTATRGGVVHHVFQCPTCAGAVLNIHTYDSEKEARENGPADHLKTSGHPAVIAATNDDPHGHPRPLGECTPPTNSPSYCAPADR